MDSFYPRNSIDESRRQMILQRLEMEREQRRKHVKDGTIDQFKLEDITNNSNNQSQQNMFYTNSTQMYGMKDPTEILLNPSNFEAEQIEDNSDQMSACEYKHQSFDSQYNVSYGQNPNINYGFNPESIYNQNYSENQSYNSKANKTTNNLYKTQDFHDDDDPLRETKQKFHERLAKHRLVTTSGTKK